MRPRRPPARAAALLLVVLVASGCAPGPGPTPGTTVAAPTATASSPATPTPGPSPSEAVAPPTRWTDCGKGFLCASLRVPKDYDDPGKGTLSVALVRLPATEPKDRVGALVVNPGGPGGSGVDFVRESSDQFPSELRKRFDLVGFDPRGVNTSSAVRCIDNLDGHADLDPSPDSAAELSALADAARSYAAACERRNPDLLPYLSTEAVVRDLDLIRQAVGDDLLTYAGFSYGTLIGSLYAERFPTHVRAMLLDGALDPSLSLADVRSGQARAFEASLREFLRDCAARARCAFHGGGGTTAAFDKLMARIDKKPLPTPRATDRRSVGPGLAQSAVLGSMYNELAWPTLALALHDAERGDGSLLLLLSDPFRGRKENGSYSNMLDAYVSNVCLDFPAPTDVASYTRLASTLTARAPHFAQEVAYNDLTCAFWPVKATGKPHRVSDVGAPPVVVVGSTGDPATPYAWAESVAAQLDGARLITRNGYGHTGYFLSRCVSRAVDRYLLDLELPKAGLRCS